MRLVVPLHIKPAAVLLAYCSLFTAPFPSPEDELGHLQLVHKVNVGRALPADHYSPNLSFLLNETPSPQLAGYNPILHNGGRWRPANHPDSSPDHVLPDYNEYNPGVSENPAHGE